MKTKLLLGISFFGLIATGAALAPTNSPIDPKQRVERALLEHLRNYGGQTVAGMDAVVVQVAGNQNRVVTPFQESPLFFKYLFLSDITLPDLAPDATHQRPWADQDSVYRRVVGQGILNGYWQTNRVTSQPPLSRFSGPGLLAVFRHYYQPPTARFQSVDYQTVYNAFARNYVRAGASLTAEILAEPGFRALAEEYRRLAITPGEAEFDALEWQPTALAQLLGQARVDERVAQARANQATHGFYYFQDRVMGILVRRYLDGSLPQCLEILKQVLKDYDPEAFVQYGDKLVLRP